MTLNRSMPEMQYDEDMATPTAPTIRTGQPMTGATALALFGTMALAVLVVTDGPASLRLPLALVTILLTPGLSIVGLLDLPRSAARLALAIAVSLAVTALTSEALLLNDRLTTGNAVAALLAVCAPFALAQRIVARSRPRRMNDGIVTRVRRGMAGIGAPTHRVSLGLTGLAAALWIAAAVSTDPGSATDLGMVSVLPVVWWVGLAALTAAFLVHLRRGVHPALAVLQTGTLIAFLYIVMTVAEAYSRIPTSYTHVGLVDYLVRDHRIADYFDARYSWPGSLSTGAVLTQLAGVESSASFVRWGLPAFVLLWALAVYAAASAYTRSARVRWLTVWVFLTLNWVGQDYWSSQALNFFFVVTAVAAVATWFPRRIFRSTRVLAFEQPEHAFTTSAQGFGLLVMLALVTAAVASSHQLSPFTLVGVLVALWLIDRRDLRLLPVMAAVITLIWISWGADDYWIGHLQRVTDDVGHVTGVVSTGTVERIANASIGRRAVLVTRLGLSFVAWATAGLWCLYAARRGRPALLTIGALAVVPLAFVALQSYGGELGLRIFLFSLPFVALLIADALDAVLGRDWIRPAIVSGALTTVLVAASVGFVVARYGNEAFEQTYPEDVAITRAFTEIAPAGAHVFGTNTSNPFRMLAYHDYRPHYYDVLLYPEVTPVENALRASGVPHGFILLYESAIKESLLRQGAQRGWHLELERQLRDLGAKERFRDRRAALFEYSIDEVEPVAPAPRPKPPYVTARTRSLLGTTALVFAGLVTLFLLAVSALHVTGVCWQAGWLEGGALLAASAVIAVVVARLVILT